MLECGRTALKCWRQTSMTTLASRRGAEPLQAQALVAEAAVERSVSTVLPRLARIDQRRFDVRRGQPLGKMAWLTNSSIVGAEEQRCTVAAHQPGKNFDHAPRADAASDVDRQALVGELVDDGQTLDLLAVSASVEHEVVSPQLVCCDRCQRARSTRRRVGGDASEASRVRHAATIAEPD